MTRMKPNALSAGAGQAPQVGAADPERRNSPIQTDSEQSFELVREQVGDEAACCYFNDQSYAEGRYVLSGSTYLRCEHGIWVEADSNVPIPLTIG